MSKLAKIEAVTGVSMKGRAAAVKAAVDKSLFSMTRALSAAGVEIDSTTRISASRLSAKLKEAGIGPTQRLEIKVALDRANLLSD